MNEQHMLPHIVFDWQFKSNIFKQKCYNIIQNLPMTQVLYEQEEEQQLNQFQDIRKNSNKNHNQNIANFDNFAVGVSKTIIVLSIAYLMWTIGSLCICWDIFDLPYNESDSSLSFCSNISPKSGARKLKAAISRDAKRSRISATSIRIKKKNQLQPSFAAVTDQKRQSPTSVDELVDPNPTSTLSNVQNMHTQIVQQLQDSKDMLQNIQNQKKIGLDSKITNQRYLKLLSHFQPPTSQQPLEQSGEQTDKNQDYLKRRRTLPFLSKIERQSAIDKYLESAVDQKSLYLQLAADNDENVEEESMQIVKRMKWLPSFDHYEQMHTFCVLVSTYNNAGQSQIMRTLNSIFKQQYEKYHVVVMDRSSTDGTIGFIRQYLNKSLELSNRTFLVERQRNSELQSMYEGLGYCSKGQIVILMNGESQLLGRKVFKLTDYTYSLYQTRVLYSDAYNLDLSKKQIEKVSGGRYDESQKFMNIYRELGRKYGYYFSFDVDLLYLVDKGHLTDSQGQFFGYSVNKALLVSLLQVCCGSITYLPEPLLLRHFESNQTTFQLQQNLKQTRAIARKSKLTAC